MSSICRNLFERSPPLHSLSDGCRVRLAFIILDRPVITEVVGWAPNYAQTLYACLVCCAYGL